MLSKNALKKEFSKDWKKQYQVNLFKEKGFERKTCKCGKNFWTLDPERTVCGDSSCEPYGFIGQSVTKKSWDYIETWKQFEKYFKKQGHASINRYPVIDRWRPDLYFTIASIQDFQRIDNGQLVFSYPENPLVVPQVCLRFPDIQNVGVTGRHHTSFIMGGQHAFGYPKEGYFKDRCIDLNFGFLHGVMGIAEKDLTYVEDVWAMPDFSAFGPSIETVSKGLEIVNHVFMQFTKTGSSYTELPIKVNDTGWGHERLVWFSQGTSTGYDAVFGDVISWMKKKSGFKQTDIFKRYAAYAGSMDLAEIQDIKKTKQEIAQKLGISEKELKDYVEPFQALYAIADHTKTLLFTSADGGIPSNVGGGYNLRVILRRALAFQDEYNHSFDLETVGERHARFLKPMFPELKEGLDFFRTIVDVERDRYKKTLKRSKSIITSELQKGITTKSLITLYTSHGITPELIETVAKKENKEFETPSDYYTTLTKHYSAKEVEKKKKQSISLENVAPTKKLYYDDVYTKTFKAQVLKQEGSSVVLDKSAFYPEGGGQPGDRGYLESKGKIPVLDTQKVGDVIVHTIKGKVGGQVTGVIDWDRRQILMNMHDATHILGGAARQVIGKHIWQAGAQKGVEKSRVDFTHYKPFTQEELEKIERVANDVIAKKSPIRAQIMSRVEAEKKYGFSLYQGGASPGKNIRVVNIGNGFDIEACGGTHGHNASETGSIRIIKTERIQDGVNRIEFVAGNRATEHTKQQQELYTTAVYSLSKIMTISFKKKPQDTDSAAQLFSVEPSQLPKTIEKFIEQIKNSLEQISKATGKKQTIQSYFTSTPPTSLEDAVHQLFTVWKHVQKQQEKQTKNLSRSLSVSLLKKQKNNVIFDIISVQRKDLISIASTIVKINPKLTVILANEAGDIVGVSKKKDMGALINDLCHRAGGSGGGRKDFAQGRIDLAKLIKVMKKTQF